MKTKVFNRSLLILLICVGFSSGPLHAAPPQKPSNSQNKKPEATANKNDVAAPGTGCALLPVSLLEKTFGEKFDEPSASKTPPAYDGAWGSSCQYFSKPPFAHGHQTRVDFMVYVEASAAEAKQTFDKAAVFFKDNSKPPLSGIGDSAYWNTATGEGEPVIHILKGKVHCQLGSQPANAKQLKDLATALATRL